MGGGALRQPQGLFRRQRNESLPGSDNLVGNAIKAGDGSRFRHDRTRPTYPIVRSWPAIKRTTCVQRTGSLYCLVDSVLSKTRFLPQSCIFMKFYFACSILYSSPLQLAQMKPGCCGLGLTMKTINSIKIVSKKFIWINENISYDFTS